MATYLYFPEWTEDHQSHAWFWLAQRRSKGKALPEVRASSHSVGGPVRPNGALGDLRAGDTLYVVIHGSVGSDYVTATYANGRSCRYSPRSLALHLQREGLPQVFLRIKLWSCGAGAPLLSQQGSIVQLPFAARLKNELIWMDYDDVAVYGYNAALLDVMIQPVANIPGLHKQAAWGTHERTLGHTRASLVRIPF
jgi:hypothetical protein